MIQIKMSLFLLLSSLSSVQNPFQLKLQTTIDQQFGSGHTFSIQELIILPATQRVIENKVGQRFASASLIYGKISKDHSTKGYYFVDTLRAKNYTFDILVLFDQNRSVKGIQILRNPDSHNSAVTHSEWLDQFIGMNSDSDFSIGNKVDAISGASLSVNSMLKGVWRLSLLLNYIVKP